MIRHSSSLASKLAIYTLQFAICISLLISCSSSKSPDPTPVLVNDSSTPGFISFKLVWQQPAGKASKPSFSAAPNVCVDYGIDTITAKVFNTQNEMIANQSWPCSAHAAVFASVPSGPGRTMTIEGLLNGAVIWKGQSGTLSVTASQTTNAGIIIMSYIAGDTAKPTILSTAPPASSTNVPIARGVAVDFSENMAASTLNNTSLTLKAGATDVPGTVNYDIYTYRARYIPDGNLSYGTTYTITVTTAATDMAGNSLVSAQSFTFTTESAPVAAPTSSPVVQEIIPGNGQITLRWSGANKATSYNIYFGLSSGVTTSNGTKISVLHAPYTHMGITNNQTYYYIVTAVNSFGEGPASSELSATPMVDTLSSGLVAYYPFNGNANDVSGNGNNGVVSGATLTADRFGNANNAYYFDGISSQISIADNATLNPTNAMTATLWFKADGAIPNPTWRPLLQKVNWVSGEDYRGYNIRFDHNSTGCPVQQYFINVHFDVQNIRQQFNQCIDFSTLSTWNFITSVYDGNNVSLYLNGVLQGSTPATGPITPSTSNLYIGYGNFGTGVYQYVKGVIDDVHIYNRALSTNEIVQLYYGVNSNIPAAPAILTATAGTSQNIISWPTVTGATSYNLYWSTSPIVPDKTAAAHQVLNVTSPYTHTGTSTGQTYYYVVTANNSYGESSESMQAHAAYVNLSQGLVAYYPFSGNANDASGNVNNGVVTGATLTTDRFGNGGGAYTFNGTSNYIKVPAGINIGSMTIAFWVKFNSTSGELRLMDCWMGDGGGGAFEIGKGNATGQFYLQVAGLNASVNVMSPLIYSTSTPAASSWYHVVGIYDRSSSAIRIFINGQQEASGTFISDSQNAFTDIYIGAGVAPGPVLGGYINGDLDDVRIYNRALGVAEIAELYQPTTFFTEDFESGNVDTSTWLNMAPEGGALPTISTAMKHGGNYSAYFYGSDYVTEIDIMKTKNVINGGAGLTSARIESWIGGMGAPNCTNANALNIYLMDTSDSNASASYLGRLASHCAGGGPVYWAWGSDPENSIGFNLDWNLSKWDQLVIDYEPATAGQAMVTIYLNGVQKYQSVGGAYSKLGQVTWIIGGQYSDVAYFYLDDVLIQGQP